MSGRSTWRLLFDHEMGSRWECTGPEIVCEAIIPCPENHLHNLKSNRSLRFKNTAFRSLPASVGKNPVVGSTSAIQHSDAMGVSVCATLHCNRHSDNGVAKTWCLVNSPVTEIRSAILRKYVFLRGSCYRWSTTPATA
jgi:hypothetical protein